MPSSPKKKKFTGTGGFGFKKGQSGNAQGSSERARKLGKIRRLTIDELAEVGTLILRNNCDALARIKNDPDASVLQTWIMAIICQSIQKGDAQVFSVMMDRLIGKCPEAPVTRDLLDFLDPQEAADDPVG